VSLFNGHDLTGWGFRVTPAADRESARKRQASDRNARPWPMVDKAVSFDGETSSPDGRYVAKNGRLIVTTPPEGRRIQQIATLKDFPKDFVLRPRIPLPRPMPTAATFHPGQPAPMP
jgi:hypothetical protein